jgi:hypothetical protein
MGDQRLPERPAASRARQLRPPKLPTTTHTLTVLLNTTLGATRASGLRASLSFSLIRDGSAGFMLDCHPCSRRLAGWSEVDDRPKADLASGRSLGSHSGSQTIDQPSTSMD